MGDSGILRIVTASLATLLIGLPAAWALLALWYQAPGNQFVKFVFLALWLNFWAKTANLNQYFYFFRQFPNWRVLDLHFFLL